MRDAADIFAHCCKRRTEHDYSVGCCELLVNLGKHFGNLVRRSRAPKNRPGLRVQPNATFLVVFDAESNVVIGDTTGVPVAVPEVLVRRFVDLFGAGAVFLCDIRFVGVFADLRPQVDGVGCCNCEPA